MATALDNQKLKDLLFTDKVDWQDRDVTRLYFHEQYIPKKPWYNEYQPEGRKVAPIVLERSFLRSFDSRESYEKPCKRTGLPWHVHFIRYLTYLYPKTDISPALVLAPFLLESIKCIEHCLSKGLDILNTLGSKSSGKTFLLGYIGFALLTIDPAYNVAYVAAPYKGTAQSTVFGEIVNAYEHIRFAHPRYTKDWKKIGGEKPTELVLDRANAKSGFVRLIGLDDVGKVKGSKQANSTRGLFLVLADELNEFQNMSFGDVIDNLTSNSGFLCITSCNYTGRGLDFNFCEPLRREYQELDADNDQLWYSAFNSLTIRFDGFRNPNVLGKREIFKFGLLSYKKFKQHMETYGINTFSYWSQIRSFPIVDETMQFILTGNEIRGSGSFEDFVYAGTQMRSLVICDPAFGGNDKCKIGAFRFGMAQVMNPKGEFVNYHVLSPMGEIEEIFVNPKLICTHSLYDEVGMLPSKNLIVTPGQPVSADIQIVIGCNQFLQKKGVDRSDFAFDSSMRGSITSAMERGLGHEITVYDYGYVPPDRSLRDGTNLKETYNNVSSAMHFCLQKIVTSGQFRGAGLIPVGLNQICRRKWERKGKKFAAESKDKYKDANSGQSPDDGDVVVMAAYKALEMGMVLRETKQDAQTGPVIDMSFASSSGGVPVIRGTFPRI